MNFNANRLRTSDRETSGGTIATLGNPLGAAETGLARSFAPRSNADLILGVGDEPSNVKEGAVPDNMAIFFAGGLVDGKGDSMPGFQTSRTDFDGYFLAGGVEIFPNDNTILGASVYHSNLDADVVLGGTAESTMWAGSVYGRTTTEGGVNFDAQASLSDYNTQTARTVSFLGNQQTLLSDDNGSGFSAGVGVSYDLPIGDATITPGVEARYANLSFGTVSENGGVTALTVERERYKSFQGRVGFDAHTNDRQPLQLNISADFVHEFESGPQVFQANFRNGSGAPAAFALATTDQNWLELGIGANLDAGDIEFGIGMESTVGRSNAEAQTYTASATIRF